MRTFNLVIHDARYPAPTREVAKARDHDGAQQIARQRLEASPYHVGVQVRADDQLLFWFRRLGQTAMSLAAQPAV